jgi:acyl-coenzyme A synthetase/AMP-(fatty) acid ligase/acyl carrier protein
LLHVYGPTENTTFSTWHLVAQVDDDARTIPIGVSIANSHAYVLDARLEPAPLGVIGELYVAGAGLANGYVHRAALTAERFVADPYANGERMYRTGDLVRRRRDGAIEFVARADAQLKIRGHRIEPGEIEAVLAAQPGVQHAAVIAREQQLVAYVVGLVREDALRGALRERLPEYMMPSAFVTLAALPLTPNGKLDWRALPAPERSAPDFRAPRTQHEQAVASIFAEVLNLDRVSLGEDFFDLGGHSLLATRVASRIRGAFDIELPLRELFRARTVESLAALIDATQRSEGRQREERVL